jgi:hypothetical protein
MPVVTRNGGSARVISVGVRHSATHRPTALPPGMTSGPALTGPACRAPRRRARAALPAAWARHPRSVSALSAPSCSFAGSWNDCAWAGSTSNTPPDRQPHPPGPCYFYCMISPIRGNRTDMGVQVPPGHKYMPLTCGYLFTRIGQVSNAAGHSHGGSSPSRTRAYVHADSPRHVGVMHRGDFRMSVPRIGGPTVHGVTTPRPYHG